MPTEWFHALVLCSKLVLEQFPPYRDPGRFWASWLHNTMVGSIWQCFKLIGFNWLQLLNWMQLKTHIKKCLIKPMVRTHFLGDWSSFWFVPQSWMQIEHEGLCWWDCWSSAAIVSIELHLGLADWGVLWSKGHSRGCWCLCWWDRWSSTAVTFSWSSCA